MEDDKCFLAKTYSKLFHLFGLCSLSVSFVSLTSNRLLFCCSALARFFISSSSRGVMSMLPNQEQMQSPEHKQNLPCLRFPMLLGFGKCWYIIRPLSVVTHLPQSPVSNNAKSSNLSELFLIDTLMSQCIECLRPSI